MDRELQIEYRHKDVTKTIIIPIVVEQKSLQKIEITEEPIKTSYIEGEKFDRTGLEVTAYYEFSQEIIENYYLDEDKALSIEDDSLVISYSENHHSKGTISKSVEQPIKVSKRTLQSLSVDTTLAKLDYVQGQKFDISNLVVVAQYDFGERIITDYEINTETRLTYGIREWPLSYTENGITKSVNLNINVDLPYTNFRKIVVEDFPNEVSLYWSYAYMTDTGEDKIDNTTYSEHDLAYNEPVGTYIIPVGAEITVEAENSAIIDFYLDGKAQDLKYPSRTMNFTLPNGNTPLAITTKKISGRSTVIFRNDVNKVVLSFPEPWNGLMKEEDLEKISFVFDENSLYFYNVYLIDGIEYSFSELFTYVFTTDKTVTVESRERMDGTEIPLVYWEGFEILLTIDQTDREWKSKLPLTERIGYHFTGWIEQGGKIIAQWEMIDRNYSGAFVGEWKCSLSSETTIAECIFQLNSNGTYEYTTTVNGELNVNVHGFYIYHAEENEINILSAESDFEPIMISPNDFGIDLSNLIDANLLVIENYELYRYEAHFEKVNNI